MNDRSVIYNCDLDRFQRSRIWAAEFDRQVMMLAMNTLTGYRLATFIEDTQKAMDGLVQVSHNGMVGMRVRKAGNIDDWSGEFTLRSKTKSNSPTEIDKVMSGKGGALAYCIESPNGKYIRLAHIIDFDVFRAVQSDPKTKVSGRWYDNKYPDGTLDGTAFRSFKYSSFPSELVLKRFDLQGAQRWALDMFVEEGLVNPQDVDNAQPVYHKLDTANKVFFYEQEFYVLSNYSSFQLQWKGQLFQTSEAAYHWEKFPTNSLLQHAIRTASSAHTAQKLANMPKNKLYRRPDWEEVKVDIMRDILRAKLEQHEYVRKKLLETGNRELIEDSWRDDFWGWGQKHDGQNVLGKLWMELRDELRNKSSSQTEFVLK